MADVIGVREEEIRKRLDICRIADLLHVGLMVKLRSVLASLAYDDLPCFKTRLITLHF